MAGVVAEEHLETLTGRRKPERTSPRTVQPPRSTHLWQKWSLWGTGKGMCFPRARAPPSPVSQQVGGAWLGLPWEGLAVSRTPKGRAAGSCVHNGSLPKPPLLFLRLDLEKGMSRDSRRKGRGWGISGAWVGRMAELWLRGELRPGGEL